jgi:Uncharacterized conserved domain (SAYSvFN)
MTPRPVSCAPAAAAAAASTRWVRLCSFLGLWWLSARYEFGVVFLICSGIAAMFVNLGDSGERGELSAYSVSAMPCPLLSSQCVECVLEKSGMANE